jgi:stearoyl-CoA desaturase (delta-9 desaturase)
LRWLDRFDILVPLALALGMYLLGAALAHSAPQLHTGGAQMLVWGFFISTVLCWHATYTINSLSHVFGRQRYRTGDSSRNNWLLAILTLGEGWHNNHHYFPNAARQGFYWWECDLTYYMLKLMSWLGLIWDLKTVPLPVRDNPLRRLR